MGADILLETIDTLYETLGDEVDNLTVESGFGYYSQGLSLATEWVG